MDRKAFTGWKDVFRFTWKQTLEGKGFKSATVVLALLLLVVGLAISVIMAFVQKDEAETVSPIETVRIADESGLAVLYLDGFAELQNEKYPDMKFEKVEDSPEELASTLGSTNPRDIIVRLTRGEEGYLITAMIPEGSEVSESDAESFLIDFQMCMEQSKLISSGIPMEKLVYAISGVSSELLSAGEEEKSIGEELVSLLLPMIVIFVLYMMTLLYGQNITNVVSVEKASKLMEQMLTMVRPEALILGKVLSIVILALLQLGLWLVCFVGGFIGGDLIAKNLIYPEYNNAILEVFGLLQEGGTGFSADAVVLFLITLCLGFLFYSALAGLIASFVSKTEEVAMCNAYYQVAVVIGFIGSYILPLQEKDWINTILRIVPFTGAFLLPGDILVGNITVWLGLGYTALLLLFTLALVVAAGKVYKAQVFNRGMSVFERFNKKKASEQK